jgi:cysteine desulfurase/selenocysteine lyase
MTTPPAPSELIANPPLAASHLRQEIIGVDQPVPLLDGSVRPYVNLDNAASTPPFRRVKERVDEAMGWYASVHRGTGYKSLLSTHLFEQARQQVARFFGADPEADVVIFTKNTTEAINKLANCFPFQPGDLVLSTVMEHHSNDLPWRARTRVLYAGLLEDGSLDLADLEHKLADHRGQVKVVAVTGASNVSGYVNPIHDIAEMAHHYGAMIAVDCAQLSPHRPICMEPAGSPRHLDFIAVSGHKLYAPFGSGALIGPRAFFERTAPDYRGGGTIQLVTLDEVIWADAPDREEAGTPNVIGAIAMAAALEQLGESGMESISAHEAELTRYALQRLARLPEVHVYGSADPDRLDDRLGVITFLIKGVPHGKVASILGYEGGIGVRNGCFCAHPYIVRLLKVSDEVFQAFQQRVQVRNRSDLPGLVRMSFGCYSNSEDVDRLVEMLKRVIKGDYRGEYVESSRTGSFTPRGFDETSLDRCSQA